MKTIEINLYKFSELSKEAQQTAIDNYRNQDNDNSFIYDEAYKTVKAFNELFNIKEGRNSWLDFSISHIDDNILNLKGLRLRTYIINNFWNGLFKGKYFSLWSKTEKSYKHYKEGYPVLKSRRSKVFFDNSCVLTGMCYDNDMLQPIYDFLDWKSTPDYNSYQDYENLINDCYASIKSTIEKEEEYRNTDEYITEEINKQENEYTENGEIY